MIFVTVGSSTEPFDRLMHAVDELDTDEPVLVQRGASRFRPSVESVAFMDFDDLVETIEEADVVVTHAGVGSVLTALANGRHPVVVPRLQQHGEAVDDHQLVFAHQMADAGLVTVVDDAEQLAAAIGVARVRPPAAQTATHAAALSSELRSFIEQRVGDRRRRAHARRHAR